MYQPHQKDEVNRLHKYISVSSPKYKSSANPIIASLQRFGNLQEVRFDQIEKACLFLQTCINNTEQTIVKLQERIHQMQEMRSTETISNLKQKQNQFIIHQLKEKLKKYEKNQQNMEIQLRHLKKQLESLKRQQKLQHNQKSLNASRAKQEISEMEKILAEKDSQIEQLTKKVEKLIQQKKQQKKAQLNTNEKLKKDKDDQFRLLQSKLMELQRDFDSKVTSLRQQVKDKILMVKKLEEEIEKRQKEMEFKQKQFQIQLRSFQDTKSLPMTQYQSEQLPSNMTLTFNPRKSFQSTTPEPINQPASISELQFKLYHQQKLYKQLQQEHTTHLTQCNNLQIQLHQQIHQQKSQLQEEKKKYKTQKKKTIQLLQALASFVNKRSFNYFDATTEVETVIEEIKKLIGKEKEKWQRQLQEGKNLEKQHEERVTQLEKQNRKIKSENNLMKQQIQNISQQLQRLVAQKEKDKQKQKQKQQKHQKRQVSSNIRQNSSFVTESNSNSNSQVKVKQSLNGSLGEISNNTKSEALTLLEEKYKTIIEALKVQIQQREQNIADLQNLQSIDFEKSKEKILAIESQLADSRNESRKLERECKQLREKTAQHLKESESLKLAIQELKQKYLKQKQALTNNHEQKVKSLEQKATKLKDQNQQIDSKCQQKVMKYNKLKSKVQKLQMYNSETQKRKDAQIEELIKKNQHLKMDCKLLEEKLNISQALQLTNQTTDGQEQTAKSTYIYNKDLIEQIQMQRDRILEQYEAKRRQHIKLKEQLERLGEQNNQLKEQILKNQQSKKKAEQEREGSMEDKQKQAQQSQKSIAKIAEEKQSLASELIQIKKQLSGQKISREIAEKQLAKIVEEQTNKSKQEYQHMKKELQSQMQLRKKLEKEQQALVERIKDLKEENQQLKKQTLDLKKEIQEKAKSLEIRWQQKYKEKTLIHHQEMAKLKEEQQRKVSEFEQKISEAQIREENLVNIINYKNMSVSGNVRESMIIEEDQNNVDEVNKYHLHEMMPITEVKEMNFGETTETETNTNDMREGMAICQLDAITIGPFVSLPKLSIQTLDVICIQAQKSFNDQSTQINILEQEEQILAYVKEKCPTILQRISESAKAEAMKQMRTKQIQQIQQMTAQNKQFSQIGINTQSYLFNQQPMPANRSSIKNKPNDGNPRESIKSHVKQQSFILDKDWLGSEELSHSSVQHMPIPQSTGAIPAHLPSREKFDVQSNQVGQINLFENLKPGNLNVEIGLDEENIDDNFQICEQGESINVGRTALNLQIKEIFNKLRQELQKVFNGEEISLSMIKILPRQLEDDYNEFIAYVRQKISEIKTENQLSFIMAEVGDSPEELQEDLDNQLKGFMEKKTFEDIFTYKKMVQEKEALITSLMNERTMQENTINQMTVDKEEMDEEHENRFMNQCNIYKKQIKELKNKVDNLEMNFQSLKNIFKNCMEIWVDEMENEDDLRDHFTIYKKIARLTETESTRLNYYIFRYRQIKGIVD